jgi:hypothetical protein
MRVGDFGVEIIPVQSGEFRELESGHVLARPGTVYAIRLRNHGPLRAVAEVRIDGKLVTSTGLVLNPWSAADLQRPMDDAEHGRFTVIAEGDERVFGPDGGRENAELGLVEVRFRRELPRDRHLTADARPLTDVPTLPLPYVPPDGEPVEPNDPRIPPSPRRPMAPPGWTPPEWRASLGSARSSIFSRSAPVPPRAPASATEAGDAIERAAGTGLTGHSSQRFVSVMVGPLEAEPTIVRLRIVIGTEEAFSSARPLRDTSESPAPSRPAARP